MDGWLCNVIVEIRNAEYNLIPFRIWTSYISSRKKNRYTVLFVLSQSQIVLYFQIYLSFVVLCLIQSVEGKLIPDSVYSIFLTLQEIVQYVNNVNDYKYYVLWFTRQNYILR